MEVPSSPFLIYTLIITIFFILFSLLKSLTNSKASTNLPPGPPKLPIIGNIHQVAGLMPHRVLGDLAKKHGPLMHLQLGQISAVVVSSPRVAREVLRTHDLNFSDRPELLLTKIVLANWGSIVFSLYGDYWRQMRKLCTLEVLSAKQVRSFHTIREEEASEVVQSIKSSAGSLVNVSKHVFKLANAITCRATIGARCKYQEELINVVEEIAYWGSGFSLPDLFPSLQVIPIGMKPALKTIRRKLDRIFDNIMYEHKEKLARKKEGNEELDGEQEDLVDVLLRVNDSDQRLEFPITTNDIQGVILDMFTAGTDTSSAVLEWAMSELVKKPSAMKKAQAEVREAFKDKERICEADMQGLTYLRLVIKETLRLHPPVPLLLPRECRKECVIDGYTIPLKTKVMVNAWAIGRDPEYWEDADSFIPERFENSPVDYMGANLEYIPFGAGRRMCAGISFGVATVEFPLSQLLYHFDWKLPDDVIKPEDLDMEEGFGATTKRKNNLFLVVDRIYTPNS